jgi:hypothetical protein
MEGEKYWGLAKFFIGHADGILGKMRFRHILGLKPKVTESFMRIGCFGIRVLGRKSVTPIS